MSGALGARALQLRLRSAPSALRSYLLAPLLKKSPVLRQSAVALARSASTRSARTARRSDCRSILGAIFERFAALAGASTKKARPLQNTGRSDRNRRSDHPRATRDRLKIVPRASRKRRFEESVQRRRLDSSRAHFLTAPGRPRVSQECPKTLRGHPRSCSRDSRSVSGVSPKAPESPKIGRSAPGTILDQFWLGRGSILSAFWSVPGRFSSRC